MENSGFVILSSDKAFLKRIVEDNGTSGIHAGQAESESEALALLSKNPDLPVFIDHNPNPDKPEIRNKFE